MSNANVLIYANKNGVRVELKFGHDLETMWANQSQMAQIFDCTVHNIMAHIKNVYEDKELDESSVCKEFLHTASDGKNYQVQHYNLDMIIAVGYRVNSATATQFRIWATKILKEYIVKGFAMDDERLKDPTRNQYFEELLERVKEIRTSEKLFYQKVKDIYSTAIDYNKNSDEAIKFFKIVQNKMLYAVCGKTAAELIVSRCDEGGDNFGLSTWSGSKVRKKDIDIAKNYLKEDEVKKLNRLTTMLLDYAEDQAERNNALTMQDWQIKLDDFIKFNEYELLDNAGEVSHSKMEEVVQDKYNIFDTNRINKEHEEAQRDAERDVRLVYQEVRDMLKKREKK
jgi:hypothetical protein